MTNKYNKNKVSKNYISVGFNAGYRFWSCFFFKYEIKFCVSALVKRYPAVYLIQFQTQGLFMFILEVK